MRVVTFGRQPTSRPPGTFRQIVFPQLALLDQGTTEGWISRKLSSDGANCRELPRTIYVQERQSGGHFDSLASAALHEVTVDGETGVLSGRGWLADNEAGHTAELMVVSKSLHHNSIDITDVPPDGYKITEHGDFWDDDFWMEVEFVNWALGATTLVGKPAFANARAEVPDEIAAALGIDEPLIVDVASQFSSSMAFDLAAGMSTRPAWSHFNRPEADIPHPFIVDEPDANGWVPVYGHLAQWRKQHRDALGNLRHPPRGYDGYTNFAKPRAILTDNGWVAAGPVTLLGGHVSVREAANNIENIWADVRVVDGKHGPWACGVMRPHIAANEIETYRARAAQVSGYWQGGVLRLICAVTAPGYPITESEEQDALVAGFTPEPEQSRGAFPLADLLSFGELSTDAQQRLRSWVEAGTTTNTGTPVTSGYISITQSNEGNSEPNVTATPTEATDEAAAQAEIDDFEFRQRQREREMALETEHAST
jgi:hypothetical protein